MNTDPEFHSRWWRKCDEVLVQGDWGRVVRLFYHIFYGEGLVLHPGSKYERRGDSRPYAGVRIWAWVPGGRRGDTRPCAGVGWDPGGGEATPGRTQVCEYRGGIWVGEATAGRTQVCEYGGGIWVDSCTQVCEYGGGIQVGGEATPGRMQVCEYGGGRRGDTRSYAGVNTGVRRGDSRLCVCVCGGGGGGGELCSLKMAVFVPL